MNVIVVGGGAAGMMAAFAAAECGHQVTLIEKNEKLGKKLFITGKGRCNFTNACNVTDLFEHVVTNPKFLYSAIYGFDNQAVMDFFMHQGVECKIERGNRVFPASDHSSDVISALTAALNRYQVKIMLHTKLLHLIIDQDRVTGVMTDRGSFEADAVILALGGKSYPACGADGDTWRIMKELNVDLTAAAPSLVPLTTVESDIPMLQGLSLKNVQVKILVDEKLRYQGFGEMLFTHFGLSGPLILSGSCYLKPEDYQKNTKVLIDLKPALDEKELDERILRDFSAAKNKQFQNALTGLLPAKLIPVVIERLKISPYKAVHDITKAERKSLVAILKQFTCSVNGNRGFTEAIITRGGVKTSAIDPKTMAVKAYKGLYVAGEMIDVDAQTGGYNLQIAWSTGHLAGTSV